MSYKIEFFKEEAHITEQLGKTNLLDLCMFYLVVIGNEFFEVKIYNKDTHEQMRIVNLELAKNYKKPIEKKLQGITEEDLLTQIKKIKEKFYFSDNEELLFLDKVYPEMLINLNINSNRVKTEVIFILDKAKFQIQPCEKYLSMELSKAGKRELLQAYILTMYMEKFSNLAHKSKELIHPSLQEIKNYMPEIKTHLKDHVHEDEIIKNFTILKEGISYLNKVEEDIINQTSIDLNAGKSESKLYRECIIINNDYNGSLTEIKFNENVCNKLIHKKLDNGSLRELVQTYFFYQYYTKIGVVLKDKSHNTLEIDDSISKIEHYIDKIYHKINGKVDDKIFDESVSIVTDWLSDEEIKTITRKVIYPIKKALNLTTPSVFGHIL